jgi:hypothetical protein
LKGFKFATEGPDVAVPKLLKGLSDNLLLEAAEATGRSV